MNKREFTPEEIAKSLRARWGPSSKSCDSCPVSYEHCSGLEVVAADLIEAQVKRIGELEELVEDRTKDVLFYAEREKWIPTSERLPELREPVLVSLRGCVQEGFLLSNGEWYCRHTVEDIEAVTHWKHMPKGPEVCHE